jgi:C-terminal processing protease CtpA/Prc
MKNGFSIKAVILIIVITSLITSLTTGVILYNNTNLLLGSTVELTDDANLKEFIRIYNDLNKDYYDKIDRKGMIEEAISAMLDYLREDYSTYLIKIKQQN